MAPIIKLEEKHFFEDLALFFEQLGIPRMAGRIVGVLLISEPPEQSITDIALALNTSKSSVSIMARFLLERDLIERVPAPMPRRDYYRFKPGGWTIFMQQWLDLMSALHKITERGMQLMVEKSMTDKERLLEAHDLFSLMEEEMPRMMKTLEKDRFERKQEQLASGSK